MKIHKIAVIPGDGIGPEVLAEGIKVLENAAELAGGFKFEFTNFPWGCEYYVKHGKMMDDDGIEQLKQFDAIYLGAVGYRPCLFMGFAAEDQERIRPVR
jgi:tartrate dehydrogenase/decarboxylase/D-malate dehydrogenase